MVIKDIVQSLTLYLKVPVTPFDNLLAIDQMQAAYDTLLSRPVKTPSENIPAGLKTNTLAHDGVDHPRIVTLGGDHTIVRTMPRCKKIDSVVDALISGAPYTSLLT